MSTAKGSSSAKKPRVAIVGTGWGIRTQMPWFREAGWEVTCMWARTPEKAKQLSQTHGIPFCTSKFSELLDNNDYDLLSIVTPPGTHEEFAIQALQKGKNVLCDKPTSLNVKEAQNMLEEAKKYPNQLSLIDHELRFLGSFQKGREWIKNGDIGEIRLVRADVHFPLSGKTWNWWFDKEQGGGVLGAIGSHMLDSILFISGLNTVKSLSGVVSSVADPLPIAKDSSETKPVTADLYSSIQLSLGPNGIPGHVLLTTENIGSRTIDITIVGSKGTVFYSEKPIAFVKCYDKDGKLVKEHLEKMESDNGKPMASVWERGTYLLAQKIKEAMVDGKVKNTDIPDGADFAQGVFIQDLLDKTRESSETSTTWKQ